MTRRGLTGLALGLVSGVVATAACFAAEPAYTIYRQTQSTNHAYELKVKGWLLRCEAEAISEQTLGSCLNAVEAMHNGTGERIFRDDAWWRDAPVAMEFRWTYWLAALGDRLENRYRLWLERRGWQQTDAMARSMVPGLKWSRPT